MAVAFDVSAFAFAHRGLWNEAAPENSISAFRNAAQEGFGAECDVHLSADGEVMVFHDFTLDRMTGKNGRISETDSGTLRKLSLNSTSDSIPTLGESLTIMGDLPMLVELKSDKQTDRQSLAKAVCEALDIHNGPAAMMSFDRGLLAILREMRPNAMLGLLTMPFCFHDQHDRKAALAFASDLKLQFIAPNILDAEIISEQESPFSETFPSWTVSTPQQLEIARRTQASPIFEKLDLPLVRSYRTS